MKRSIETSYLGVDPGDRWIGLAILTHTEIGWVYQSRVFDRNGCTMYQVGSWFRGVLRDHLVHTIVMEMFQQRRVGHQSFSKSMTSRLIGVIEYLAGERSLPLHYVPTNNPKLAPELWGRAWPKIERTLNLKRAEHAQSAWRILGEHLALHQLDLFKGLR